MFEAIQERGVFTSSKTSLSLHLKRSVVDHINGIKRWTPKTEADEVG